MGVERLEAVGGGESGERDHDFLLRKKKGEEQRSAAMK